ncbi:hypothetical protein [Thioalkalivibrio sp. ALE16]|uniref:hypothetical protein n=1 Tax=Thioalkalivibrio sp. ALE16 TaxID=1158172 RepID=UPI0003791807|nr:hypothetical protein [Thioalkalivibrio sp. ALE16]
MARAFQGAYGLILCRNASDQEEQETFASAFDWCIHHPDHWTTQTMGAIERSEESGRYVTNGLGYTAITTRIEDLFKNPRDRGAPEPPEAIWIPTEALLERLMGPMDMREGKDVDYLRLRTCLDGDLMRLNASGHLLLAGWLAKIEKEGTSIAVI